MIGCTTMYALYGTEFKVQFQTPLGDYKVVQRWQLASLFSQTVMFQTPFGEDRLYNDSNDCCKKRAIYSFKPLSGRIGCTTKEYSKTVALTEVSNPFRGG